MAFKALTLAAMTAGAVMVASVAGAATYVGETTSPFPGFNSLQTTYVAPETGVYTIDLAATSGLADTFFAQFTFSTNGSIIISDSFLLPKSFTATLTAGTSYAIMLSAATAATLTISDAVTTLPSVPVPATLPLLAGALGVAGLVTKKKRKNA